MGHIFPACSVSNEMVEIFVGNVQVFESFAVSKAERGPGLVGGSYPGRQAGSCQPPAACLECLLDGSTVVALMSWTWLNSWQYWLLKSISKKKHLFILQNSAPGKHLFIYMFYLWDKCSLLETWRPFELYLKWRFFLKEKKILLDWLCKHWALWCSTE